MTYYDFYPRRPAPTSVSALPTGVKPCGCPQPPFPPFPPFPPMPEPVYPSYIPVPGPQGPQGPQGVQGPMGPQGPEGRAGTSAVPEAVQAQLTGATSVAVGSPVLFNNILTQAGLAIAYNAATGEFTISDPGTYEVQWMVNPELTASTVTAFTVDLNGTPVARSDAYISEGQLTGDALVNVLAAPAVIRLTNASGGPISFSANAEVDANIVIKKV